MRHIPSRSLLLLGVLLVSGLAACSSGGGTMTSHDLAGRDDSDLSTRSNDDGGAGKPDLAKADLSGADLSSGGGDMASSGLPCVPGSYRCGMGNSVEICNSTGSAWLYSSTCAVSCSMGLCTGACTPGVRRCNVKNVEECNPAGTVWNKVDSCSGSCSSGKCALISLDITMNQNLDGDIVVDGDVVVHSGVTVSSPSGDSTIHAKNITVENMATITIAARGNPWGWGNGGDSGATTHGGGGGSNGSRGGSDTSGGPGGGGTIGSDSDANVFGGGNGGGGWPGYGGAGGIGGGAVRLIATNDITVAGFITANGSNGAARNPSYNVGGGGGGAGGGILLAAGGSVTASGVLSTSGGGGGAGGTAAMNGGAGGNGRVKILAGDKRMVSGTVNGTRTDGLLPPLVITSASHPDPQLIYNDAFDSVDLAWTSPFAARQGYYQLLSKNVFQVPTPATAGFVTTETKSYAPSAVSAGTNYFHILAEDAMSIVGTVESAFQIQVNSTPPSLSSDSHPSSSTWYPNADIHFLYSLPVADRHVQGVYHSFDNYGDTVPTKADTFVPLPQKTLMRSGVAPGVWVLHMLARDQRGYLTKAAAHFRVQVGDDPGNGVVLGLVTDGMGKPISGAQVSINRGLWSQSTNSSGNYNFPTVSAATKYELRITAGGKTATQMISVTKGMSTTANVSLP